MLCLVTLVAFEALAVSTAMPVVAADLHAIRDYGLAFSVFLTTSLLGTVVAGGWCDARGPLGPVRVGLILFGGGLLLCGLTPSFALLLAGRAVAGVGGGLLIVTMYVMIVDLFPAEMQSRLFSLWASAWVLPAIVGPLLAGWLTEHLSWRAVFLLVPPLTLPPALALLPRLRAGVRRSDPLLADPLLADPLAAGPSGADSLTADRSTSAGSGRIIPTLMAGAGVAAGMLTMQWGLSGLGRFSATEGLTVRFWLALVAVGAGLIAAATGFARLAPAGTLVLRRGLPTVVALRGLYAATFYGVEAFIPLMLVTQRGLSVTQAGLVLSGGAIGWSFGALLQARLRVPRPFLLVGGALILGLSICSLVLVIRPPVPGWAALPVWILTALGMGATMSTTSVLLLELSEPGEEGRNSSALQVSDSLGGALGIGLTGAAFAAWHHPHGAAGADAGLFTTIWLIAGVVALVCSALGFRAGSARPRLAKV